MVVWLRERCVDAAVMEGTGIYWLAPFEALEAAGIPATLVNARQVKQLKGRKTDVADSVWLARVCQFALATASHVPPKTFRELRVLTRYRRTLVGQRSRVRNRVQKVLDRSGVRVGGVLSDVFGANGRRILDGLARGLDPDAILASLSHHVAHKLERLGDALRLELSAVERLVLCDLLREHDALQERIHGLDHDIDSALEPWSERITLLQTIPGIDRRRPAPSSPRSDPTSTPSPVPSASPHGRACVRAMTAAPASAARPVPEGGTRRYARCSSSALMARRAPTGASSAATTRR